MRVWLKVRADVALSPKFTVQSYKKSKRILFYVCATALLLFIGECTINILGFLGGSYLSVYALGMIFEYEEFKINRKSIKTIVLVVGICAIIFGLYFSRIVYMNIVAGIHVPVGIDKLVPNLSTLNPPNLSICIYSAGIVIVSRIIFGYLNSWQYAKIIEPGLKSIEVLGKYSLDIFIWHILIQNIINQYSYSNIYVKRIIFYAAMFCVPILFRKVYMNLKGYIYELYKAV